MSHSSSQRSRRAAFERSFKGSFNVSRPRFARRAPALLLVTALGFLTATGVTGCGGSDVAPGDVAGRGGSSGQVASDGGRDAVADATDATNTTTTGSCHTDDQCAGTTPRCDLTTGRCAGCVAGGSCAGGSACDPSTGACVECVSDDDCGAPTPTCDLTRHQCVATCRANLPCQARQVCDTTTGSCLDCVRDTDCARPLHCDRTQGQCVDCLVDADCPADAPVCTAGRTCSDACASDADCQDGLGPQDPLSFCDPKLHLCVDCLNNVECGADSFCRSDGTCG